MISNRTRIGRRVVRDLTARREHARAVAGLDWRLRAPGSRLAVGPEVVLEITGYAAPCATIKASFAGGSFKRISQKVNPGESRLYARVLSEGRIGADDEVRVLDVSGQVARDSAAPHESAV